MIALDLARGAGQRHIMLFLRTKPPVKREEYEWLLACFAWLRTVLDDADIRPELVLPGNPELSAAQTAPELFDAVKRLAGMEEWVCRLERFDAPTRPSDPRIVTEVSDAAVGTFSVVDEEVVIRYSSAMLRQPEALAATFAHELCHYLLVNAGDPPGGPDLLEHATDCAAVYVGFGVLLANSARTFEQWNDGEWSGWQSSASGYLSEQALVTATAMFAALHDYPWEQARDALKPYLQGDLKKAAAAVRKDHPDFKAALKSVDLLQWRYA